jgi:hypothetical protein
MRPKRGVHMNRARYFQNAGLGLRILGESCDLPRYPQVQERKEVALAIELPESCLTARSCVLNPGSVRENQLWDNILIPL